MKKPLIVIAGATATGKSNLAVNIAKHIGGEIISADSMQIYKYMDIGTAKISEKEMKGIKHHLIDVLTPDSSFDAITFKNLATKAMDDIYANGHIPIIAGGTGFYIQAVTRDIDFTEEDENLKREEITEFYNKYGEDSLFERLKEIDEESTHIIPKQNVKRVIRAIEFYEIHHKKISEHNSEQQLKTSPYNLAYFVIDQNRKDLYEKIDRRVDIMMKEGLLEETRILLNKYEYDPQSGFLNAIGYKELIEYLNGNISLERAVELIKQNSRHYAKRQITFFKREKDAIYLNRDELNEEMIENEIIKVLKNKEIIE
ncbi:MAG: tRNA (adenosine(37)-N6)-dimethylallyltransferase MiaA [Lachnospiraceae bacterium]|nr:tRNA (adenosine(37)-N6)-dimethylallyltransferase MiaA [Lachnospiraceae bacterium]